MRKWSKEFTCQRCGKKFTQTFGDAILPKDRELMQHPLCKRCRVISKMQKATGLSKAVHNKTD